MSTGVRVTGLRQTIRALERLGVSVDDLKGAMTNVANKTVNDAKALTPVRTGRLRDSIRSSKAKNKVTIRAGYAKTIYASFVEYGSIHNTAVGMVNEAVSSNAQYTVSALEHEVDSLVRRYRLN